MMSYWIEAALGMLTLGLMGQAFGHTFHTYETLRQRQREDAR